MSDLLNESAGRLFADWRERAVRALPLDTEAGPAELLSDLWAQLEEQGFPLALLSEEEGGFGLEADAALVLLRLAAENALSLPLGETMTGRWLAARAGLAIADTGVVTWAVADTPAAVDFKRVPWAAEAQSLLLIRPRADESGMEIAALGKDEIALTTGWNILNEPRFDVRVKGTAVWRPLGIELEALKAMGAMIRAVSLSGAIRSVLEMTLDYSRTRKQFGKPLASFQVLQHNMAQMASQAASAGAAAGNVARAFRAWSEGRATAQDFVLHAAAAKIRTGEAAGLLAGQSHQIHAAIGITHEYPLHAFTRRLWAWRDEGGSEAYWAKVLGWHALAAPELWNFLTDVGEVTA